MRIIEGRFELQGQQTTLYHQTDLDSARAIALEGKMVRGSSDCAAGSGIYFATSKTDSDHKAHRKGVYLTAEVCLGRAKTISTRPRTLSFHSLQNEGYDSAKLSCFNGDEYVVYNHSQVVSLYSDTKLLDDAFLDRKVEELVREGLSIIESWKFN